MNSNDQKELQAAFNTIYNTALKYVKKEITQQLQELLKEAYKDTSLLGSYSVRWAVLREGVEKIIKDLREGGSDGLQKEKIDIISDDTFTERIYEILESKEDNDWKYGELTVFINKNFKVRKEVDDE